MSNRKEHFVFISFFGNTQWSQHFSGIYDAAPATEGPFRTFTSLRQMWTYLSFKMQTGKIASSLLIWEVKYKLIFNI